MTLDVKWDVRRQYNGIDKTCQEETTRTSL